jgi:hypothetical protein
MFKAGLDMLKVVPYRANMSRPCKWKLALIVLSLALVSVPAGQAAYAAPPGSAPTGKVPSSGIGLAANLPERGVGVLPNSTYYERASKSRLWAQTPAGLVYRSCVYNVPSGSYVDSIHDRITLPNGRVLLMKPCPYPRLTLPGTSTAPKPKTAAAGGLARSNGNWIDGFEADSLPHLGGLSVSIAAPYPPNRTNSSLWEYQWTALQSSDGQSLLQPAVGWGGLSVSTYRPPLAGDTEMASYYYWSGNSVAGTFYSVNPLDTLNASVFASNCGSGGGGCTWGLQIVDENTGQDSTLTVGSSPVYTSVVGELESNVGSVSGANCQSLFANHHLVWRHLQVQTETLSVVSPSYYDTGTDDGNPGAAVRSDSGMSTTWSTSGGQTAADTTWSNSCTGF